MHALYRGCSVRQSAACQLTRRYKRYDYKRWRSDALSCRRLTHPNEARPASACHQATRADGPFRGAIGTSIIAHCSALRPEIALGASFETAFERFQDVAHV